MAITLKIGDAAEYSAAADMIFTDPPYDMPGDELASIIARYHAPHLVMLTTMRQLLEFQQYSDYELCFDFVLDAVAPKKSKSVHAPNYVHQTGVYMKAPGVGSVFDRRRRQRSDTFDNNGYWPTILRAPRERMGDHGMAKNLTAMTDIIGSFEIASLIDPFAGSGTVGLAAHELGLECLLVEMNAEHAPGIIKSLKFMGAKVDLI